MRGRVGNVHGHLHSDCVTIIKEDICMQLIDIPDPMYFNVNIEDNDYKLVPLDTIKEYFKENDETTTKSPTAV